MASGPRRTILKVGRARFRAGSTPTPFPPRGTLRPPRPRHAVSCRGEREARGGGRRGRGGGGGGGGGGAGAGMGTGAAATVGGLPRLGLLRAHARSRAWGVLPGSSVVSSSGPQP